MVSPLVSIICDYLIKYFHYRLPEEDLAHFAGPICRMVDQAVVRKLGEVQAQFGWYYPDVFVRVYKEALSVSAGSRARFFCPRSWRRRL